VQPEIIAFAGNDTSVVINQPLQLHATGGVLYEWLPATGLSADNIADPVAQFISSPAEGYYTYKVRISNETGCVDSASVRVNIYSTLPEIYVPTAFTPNSDGHNDFFRLVAPGIELVKVFRVYNRWGQLIFETNIIGEGWNGILQGKPSIMDVYTWTVEAIGVDGKHIKKTGNSVLIR
jgi:gliding motility-associated-like protein